MTRPGRAATILYAVLLVLVAASIVFLSRGREREPATEPRGSGPPNRAVYVAPYRKPSESWYDSTVDSSAFVFNPYTVEPRCVDRCSGGDLLAHVPDSLRGAGITCRVLVGLHVSTEGRVTDTEILRFSGGGACNEAVEAWARTTRWTSAFNKGEPVAVWIAHPVDVMIP
jgi:TonB-like protein